MSALKKMCSEPSEDDYARSVMLDDLQLAAELGKTLLERNKELETALKQHQNIIEDQAQEIEYLTKQTVALREVNDSRLRIYEQLEVSIQDLERANHRLVLENSAEKKHVKSLNTTIESLETKCEEFQSTIDDLRLQVDVLRRRSQRNDVHVSTVSSRGAVALRSIDRQYDEERRLASPDSSATHTDEEKCDSALPKKTDSPTQVNNVTGSQKPNNQNGEEMELDSGMEQMSQLLAQLSKTRAQCNRDERRIAELEEQLSTMVQQNQALENQVVHLSHKEEDLNMKSMHEELTTLEEVKQGQMCSRCLRSLDNNSSEVPDDDDSSMLEELMSSSEHRSSFSMDVQAHSENQSSPINKQPANPYKELVEKYEALVEVHRKPIRSNKQDNSLSLQEEMQMSGDFNTLSTKDTDEESGHGDSLRTEKHKKTRKTFSTPTDFSEAETSSSGFADETSNKSTQTEGRIGSFLCTIADGEDCKFSIYDDASPIDSRFRDRPEYRVVFKEIFKVLKKAAENKEEGDELPLLDDFTPVKVVPKVPPVTPSNDHSPEFPDDDTQSVLSSTMSELSTSQNEPTTVIENIIQAQNQPIPEPEPEPENETVNKQERVLKPLVRQPLEYLSVEVRKRSSSRRKNKYVDRSDSPITHIIGSPKINYSSRPNSGRRRREQKNTSTDVENNSQWNGNTLQFWSSNRNVASPTPSQGSTKYEFKPSSASQDLHKLKKLDLSYAEVLRNADTKKRELLKQRRK
ncbi:cerebellar degeneration-related protein 2-like isoform X2 [Anoplophora glabripennis]|uniref:cerebellar degeneration-related protein 2-like isoform X2 n=1 Tax=Anoplophora glabripennis TaxID=217634 RepID=UPI000875A607|nr:cerebellar degeneration-related protein 2-like isoform X2 [Anoplophora glabripennis]